MKAIKLHQSILGHCDFILILIGETLKPIDVENERGFNIKDLHSSLSNIQGRMNKVVEEQKKLGREINNSIYGDDDD